MISKDRVEAIVNGSACTEADIKELALARLGIGRVLDACGGRGKCRDCDADIFWMTTKLDKRMPVDLDGVPHFGTCTSPKWRDKQKKEASP